MALEVKDQRYVSMFDLNIMLSRYFFLKNFIVIKNFVLLHPALCSQRRAQAGNIRALKNQFFYILD